MKQILGLKDFSLFFEMEQLRASEASTLEYRIDVHDEINMKVGKFIKGHNRYAGENFLDTQ